ncbi:unnamed protein product [Larinioides sclopetarius]|uniref:Uncharacterized protein n=1 Tax=Larinioides sclopetarius TaxID=280406 RepID=A0AAV1YXT1_9ARAC
MKHPSNRLRSAFVLQIIIIHIHTSTCYYPMTKRSAQNATINMKNFLRKQSFCRQMECSNPQMLSAEQKAFNRDTKSGEFPRMLAIDLSQLYPRSPGVPTGSRHKPLANLLGVDISVLSQNPAPNLPIAPPSFDITRDGKMIHENNFDPRYDRLPRLENDHANNYLPHAFTKQRNPLLYPFQHLPLNIMTTYHFVAKNKKQEGDLQTDHYERGNDNEKKYTANFILHLLYQLSSNYQGDFNQ